MNVETIEDLFLTELQRAYSVETRLTDELATLEDDAGVDALDGVQDPVPRDEVTEALADQRAASETHAERLEAALEALGHRPDGRSTPALDGILAEKEQFNNVVLNDEIRPLYYLGTAQEITTHEIARYDRLLRLAAHVDVPDEAVDALEENHREDLAALERLDSIADSDAVASLTAAIVDRTGIL